MIYQGHSLSLDWLNEGIAELNFSATGSVNTLDSQTLTNLAKALDKLDSLSGLTGLIISSSKDAFIVGADIKEFLTMFSAPLEKIHKMQRFANTQFNRLEDLSVPVVVAIDGYALGGGCELALACDYRVATAKARIGLPETKLGIIPGFGGTVRLPRLIGNDNALELITSGKDVSGSTALKLGLVDCVVNKETLHKTAIKVLTLAVDQQSYQARRRQKTHPQSLSQTECQLSFTTAKARVIQHAGKHYPAPLVAVQTIESAVHEYREQAQEKEIAAFTPLAQSDTAHALIGLFLNDQVVKAKAKKLIGQCQSMQSAAVLGAGIMGGGIAWQAANTGVSVRIKDISAKALEAGVSEARRLSIKQVERKKMDINQLATVTSRILPQLDYSGFDHTHIVIEAVVEDPVIKTAVLTEAEQQLNPKALLVTNTSTIPVTSLAKALQRPQQFCGMHFFNPVPKMPLVEVIRGEQTSDETINNVVKLALDMGKTPIIVNDCPGFFVNRVLFPYFAGFSLLIQDGVDYQKIDRVMEQQFGWPMGPSWLLDVVGIDTSYHARKVMAAGYPDRMKTSKRDVIDLLFEIKHFGQKTGKGFWRWETDSKGKVKRIIDAGVREMLYGTHPIAANYTDEDICDRLMIPMINEVVRCLEEGVIASPSEADMALVYGLGFPPFKGGVFRYLDTVGNDAFVEKTKKWQHLGALYQPPVLLQDKVSPNQRWYPLSDISRSSTSLTV